MNHLVIKTRTRQCCFNCIGYSFHCAKIIPKLSFSTPQGKISLCHIPKYFKAIVQKLVPGKIWNELDTCVEDYSNLKLLLVWLWSSKYPWTLSESQCNPDSSILTCSPTWYLWDYQELYWQPFIGIEILWHLVSILSASCPGRRLSSAVVTSIEKSFDF